MARIGAIRNDETVLAETICAWSLYNRVLGTNQPTTVVLENYQMPMTGTLVVEMAVTCFWSGNAQGVSIHLDGSSPAPDVWWGADCVENGLDAPGVVWGQPKTWAVWTGLAKGTVISLNLTLAVGYFPPSVTFDQVQGTYRAYRS